MELHELKYGELFICDLGAHKGYLYKFERNVFVSGKLDHSMATELGELVDGTLRTRGTRLEPSNWNPYCNVYRVKLVAEAP